MAEQYSLELYHYGIKGMKWGVRRYQNKDGSLILPKGSVVKRVTTSRDDPTYDNKKYVSINSEDHDTWDDYLGTRYARMGWKTYTQTYRTTKALKVMESAEQGKKYLDMLMENDEFRNRAVQDTEYANRFLNNRVASDDPAINISRNMAAQTATGKAFIKRVIEDGYDALADTHGKNVSENPLIVLNPDSNLKLDAPPEPTQAVRDYMLKRYGIRI